MTINKSEIHDRFIDPPPNSDDVILVYNIGVIGVGHYSSLLDIWWDGEMEVKEDEDFFVAGWIEAPYIDPKEYGLGDEYTWRYYHDNN